MFENPFASAETKLLKSLSKKFTDLNTNFEQSKAREIELANELAEIEAFQANPFETIKAAKQQLIEENISFIPSIELDEKNDDMSRFSIHYNDITVNVGVSVQQLSDVGLMRAYKGAVHTSDPLSLKAFYRILCASASETDLKKLRPKSIDIYVDFLKATGNQKTIEKWEANIKAIAFIDKTISEYTRKYRHDAHRAQQSNGMPLMPSNTEATKLINA